MIATADTGSFWTCPKCRKHVPSRSLACRCGYDRQGTTDAIGEVSVRKGDAPDSPARSHGWVVWALVAAAALTVGVYVAVKSPTPNPADSELAQKLRRRREAPPQQPQVVYIPVPQAPPSTPSPPIESPIVSTPVTPSFLKLAIPVAVPVPSAATLSPTVALESEMDIRRRLGAEDFERAMSVVAIKADQADVAWQRFVEGCHKNVTSVTAVAGAADRQWLVFAGVNVTTSQSTAACAEAGTFFALVRQVRSGVCVAEDRARQSWVYPGVRRDLRRKYRLDWDGWETACQ
jgi:hypothetical protein